MPVEVVAGRRVGAPLAQGPGRLLDRLGRAQDVRGRPLGLPHDGVQGEGGLGQTGLLGV
ncbi:hypothetical protein ACRAWG_29680 [Methylobacterium sp. P31]